MSILIENVSKKFGTHIALSNINLEVAKGKLVALLGPSGSGKSTLLRILAGFEKPDTGTIWLAGQNATLWSIQQRQLGFVFQDYALFPKMTVVENIGFGLTIQNKSPEAKVRQLLELTQLENWSHFYPHQLSGGQQQRVAFARALALDPKILLLDEPFGALDIKVRKHLRIWLRNLHAKLDVTSVLITHDIPEAMEIADDIVVLNNGYLEQVGCAQEICEYPATQFVRSLL